MSNLTVFPSSAVSAHHWTSKSCSNSLLFRHRTFWRIWEDNPQPQYVIFILTFSTKANLCYVPPAFPTPPFPWTKSPNISGTTCYADFLKEIIFRFRDYKSLLFWHFLCFIQIICRISINSLFVWFILHGTSCDQFQIFFVIDPADIYQCPDIMFHIRWCWLVFSCQNRINYPLWSSSAAPQFFRHIHRFRDIIISLIFRCRSPNFLISPYTSLILFSSLTGQSSFLHFL